MLGLATMMSLVFGVMAWRKRSKGKARVSSVWTRTSVVRHEADRDVVHEEGGGADEGFVAFVEEGAGDEVDGLVDAVGEDDLVRFEA